MPKTLILNILRYILTFPCFLASFCLFSQMQVGNDTLLGNEWIDYEQSYFKFKIATDGVYQIGRSALVSAGIPVDQIDAGSYRLYWMGQEQLLWSSNEGVLQEGDFLEFFGRCQRTELDRYLFLDPDNEMLNPDLSFLTDTSVYFLTWDDGNGLRYRLEENDLTSPPPARTWYLHTEKLIQQDVLFKPVLNSQGVRFSHYLEAEGFATAENTMHSFDMPTAHVATTGPLPTMSYRFSGNAQPHEVDIKWNGTNTARHVFDGAPLIDSVVSLSTSDLESTSNITFTTSGGADRINIGQISLTYGRSFEFDGTREARLEISDARDGAYLELTGFSSGEPILYDLSAGYRMQGTVEGNVIKIHIPPGPVNRLLYLVDPTSSMAISDIEPVSWEPLDQSDATFVIISNQALYNDGQGTNWVAEYGSYRESATGGGFRVQLIEIQQLVDQFAYGVEMHPLSIKNFVNYIVGQWSTTPYIFLLGKGLEQREARFHEEPYEFLPVYGLPGSDNILVSRFQSSVPLLPVGRVAARNAQHIQIYLDKVKKMEEQIVNAPQTIAGRAWMKKVLHLGGGVGGNEIQLLLRKLDQMKDIISNNPLGADVSTWSIQSQDVIDFNNDQTVIKLINDGLILKTYFGHGSIFSTQFNGFEDPQFLDNKERYPVMISLGCHTGNIFIPQFSLGESNILAEDKGASIYMATSGLGFLSALDVFGREWYDLVSSLLLNESVGKVNQEVIRRFDSNNSIGVKTLMQQLVLHGDPAFRMSRAVGPDYTIDFNSASFRPTLINTNQDSFEFVFDLYNLGIASDDSIEVQFTHRLPEGTEILLLRTKLPTPAVVDSVKVYLPLKSENNLRGINTLYVEINPDRVLEESPDPQAYNNNSLMDPSGIRGVTIPIVDNSVAPLYPPEFSIVPTDRIELIAGTSNPLAEIQDYLLEMDTTEQFDSPILETTRINQLGGLIKWQPGQSLIDSTVYYWRVTPDTNTFRPVFIWQNSSLIYIKDSPQGWCQSHFFQFGKDRFDGLALDGDRKLSFSKKFNEIRIFNVIETDDRVVRFFYDGQEFASPIASPLDAAISMIVVNPINQSWLVNSGGLYNSASIPRNSDLWAFDMSKPESRAGLIQFLMEGIPDGHFVFLFTHIRTQDASLHVEDWAMDSVSLGTNIFQALENQGALSVRQLETLGTVPYNFFYEQNIGPLDEDIALSRDASILNTGLAQYLGTEGALQSTVVGPSHRWTEFQWDFEYSSNNVDDFFSVEVVGLDQNQNNGTVLSSLEQIGKIDLSSVDAQQYPFIQLELSSKDDADRSSPDLNRWKVLFDGLPDAAINPNALFLFDQDTSAVGRTISISTAIENITSFDMDSLLVKYTVIDPLNKSISLSQRQAPLPGKGQIEIQYSFDTDSFVAGEHLLLLEVNPGKDQPEADFSNNLLIKRFVLKDDQINPVLDVTFDGVRIMNGDIVSPIPLIRVQLDDENRNVLIQDSTLFTVRFQDPDGSLQTLEPGNAQLSFIPASEPNNQAALEIRRQFEEDGLYTLILQGKDASDNQAGKINLRIQFKVITATSVSNVLPYPNPFQNSTRFLYTLTGEIPHIFKIQIMTVGGSVVREISKEELGSLKVGTHMTDYTWDGTDDYGDKLANGIYLFRVIAKDVQGEQFDKFETGVESLFEKELGKIVILR